MPRSNADPYVLPNGTLRNKLGLTDPEALQHVEAALSMQRYALLAEDGPQGAFDFDRLKQIHRYLFQDVYHWAGEMRTVPLAKADYEGGALQYFAPPRVIRDRATVLFDWLEDRDYFMESNRAEFAESAAEFFGRLNQIHPFREGNGRTQRAFLEALARAVGHELRFDVVSRERMIAASIEAMTGRTDMFARMFEEIMDPRRVAPLIRAIEAFERHDIDWNDRYLTTTTPGRHYSGIFVGQDSDNFVLRSGGHIYVGASADLDEVPEPGAQITVFTRTRVT